MFCGQISHKVDGELNILINELANLDAIESLEEQDIVIGQKSWTATKRVHAAERGRLATQDNPVDENHRSLYFQKVFIKNEEK